MRRLAPWVVGVVLGVCLVGAPSAGAFQGPWAPAVDLSATVRFGTGGRYHPSPQVAIAPDGTTTAVWLRFNGRNYVVQAGTRPPGGTFGAPINLSAPGGSAYSERVAVAADGTTTVVWQRLTDKHLIVQARTRPPHGTFGAPITLSAPGQGAYSPQVAVAADGTTIASWSANGVVQARTRPPGGTFAPPVDLPPGAQVAVGADGTTTAVWYRRNGADTNFVVQASTRPPGGTFGPPVDLSAPGEGAVAPRVAVGADGTTTAIWDRLLFTNFSVTSRTVQAGTRPPGGTFGPPVDLSTPGRNVEGIQVVVAADGTTTAIWSRSPGSNGTVQASTRPPGGTFGAPVDLSSNGSEYQVAAGADGTTTAIWAGPNHVVQARTRPPGGTFGAPVDLSGNAVQPHVAVGADGAATAVWYFASLTKSVVRARFTANPPVSRSAPTVAGAPTLGATLRCKGATFTGAVSIVTTWLRGATPIATGASHEVTTGDQGTALACRARAANPYGATDSRSTPLSIPPGPPTPPSPAEKAPVARSLPRVTGTPRVGHTLRCRPGGFTGTTSTSTSWLRGTTTIPGARTATYTLTRADSGKTIACRTTANGPGGTSTTISLRTRARR